MVSLVPHLSKALAAAAADLSALQHTCFSPILRLREALLIPNREGARQPVLFPHAADFDNENALRFTARGLEDPALLEWQLDIYRTTVLVQQEMGRCDMDALVARAKRDIETLESRRSRVVFVRFPSGGRFLEVETDTFSREECFDRVVEETAADGIHFCDHADRLYFECAEWSHLDAKQAVEFTSAFLDIAEGKGFGRSR